MQPFTERSPESGDQPDANVYSNVRMTVQEAAAALGITVEAVRGRMHRGKYGREKTEDGRVYVVLTPDQLPNGRERFEERVDPVEDLRDHIAFLRAELEARNEEIRRREEEHREEARRKDTIIAQLTQRIPELEAPSETQESPRTASEEPYSTHAPPVPETPVPEAQHKRSWWRAFFGLE